MLRAIVGLWLPVATRAISLSLSTASGLQSDLREGHYFKASGMATSSSYTAPFNLSGGPSWSWHHPKGRAYTLTFGTVIDDEKNIYLSAIDGIRKFTAAGKLLWEHLLPPPRHLMNTASLANGAVYSNDQSGFAFALSMATGEKLWERKVAVGFGAGQNNGFTNLGEGIMVVDSYSSGDASQGVSGLNATDGSVLWTYTPTSPVWNFGALFPGDGSVVFQDLTGVAYRLQARDGKLIWTSGKHEEHSFTDGTANIDADGNVYTVENLHEGFSENSLGRLTKRRHSDGHQLWQAVTPHPPNNQPLIGHGLVIQAMGAQKQQYAYTHVYAYDQETGEQKWVFHGPAQQGPMQAGDAEFFITRATIGMNVICYPNPWSAPGFGEDGVVYIGNQEGGFYSLRDANGDGIVSGPDEVTVYDTKAAFAGSSSPAIAPGIVAIASCDSLFVFKE